MATKNINEQDKTAKVDQEADVLVSQAGDGSESGKRVLRRASIAAVIAALRNAGVNNGYVSEETMRNMYPDLVKAVEPSENGIIVQYFDGAKQEIPIESGGLAFDEVSYDQDSGYLHIRLEGEDVVDPCYIGDGRGGAPGKDGITPHIGENGNWFIGETDTGVRAEVVGVDTVEIEPSGYDDSEGNGCGCTDGKDGIGITNITITEE